MAYIATCTDRGRVKQTNEDACCVEVAETPLGEVLMAVVCDGVGGLARGELASSTVVERLSRWFEEELPGLMEGMLETGAFDFSVVRLVWGALLAHLNDLIRSYGASTGGRLGTTFSGLVCCDGTYLLGHVGDCRVLQVREGALRQVSEDQTLLQRMLSSGELSPEEAQGFDRKHVILQSVGTERTLKPAFSSGRYTAEDLFVICCDGVWRKAGNEGVYQAFQGVDHHDEAALERACQQLLLDDLAAGERDNLTIVCFSGDLRGADADAPTMVYGDDGDDTPTSIEGGEA